MKRFESTRKLLLQCGMGVALSLLYLGTPVNAGQEEKTSLVGAGAEKRKVRGSDKVAQIAFPDQRLVEIYDTGDGVFSYVQSGPYGTTPVSLPDDVAEHGDPLSVFRNLAPGQAIPGTLTWAVSRAEALRSASGPVQNKAPDAQASQTAGTSQSASSPAETDRLLASALGSRDTNESGGTGQVGCPEWWFNQMSVNGQLFCPNEGKAACYKWVNWAFLYNSKGWHGYGAVCSDSGTAIFQTTYNQTVDTFWVDPGTWRFVQYYPYRSCSGFPWYSCDDVRTFQKFELLNGPAVAHFGARIY